MDRFLDMLPEWVLVIGIPLSILIGLVVINYTTDRFEGLASIGLLVIAISILWNSGKDFLSNYILIPVAIIAFAFLGILFDRAGNFIYNKPLLMMCPADTELVRDVVVERNYDDENVSYHYFSCYSWREKKIVKEFPIYVSVGLRFFEYLLIGSVLLGVYLPIATLRRKRKPNKQGVKS